MTSTWRTNTLAYLARAKAKNKKLHNYLKNKHTSLFSNIERNEKKVM